MATALAQQLRQLAVASGRPVGTRNLRGKPSVIWSPQEAADIDLETVYQLGREGFSRLCQVDARFGAYDATLFGPGAKELDRSQQAPDVVAALDRAIDEFCTLLSPAFLLPEAFQALEWLIRRFSVQERNVASIMVAALPSHATNEFVRLVQISSLRGTLFEFLEPMQASGAALQRPTLVQRCLSDSALFEFLLELARKLGTGPLASRSGLPFIAATVCEYLAERREVTEQISATLLPFIVAGLSTEALADYRAATLMIISQLAVRASLSQTFVTSIVLDVCRSATPATLSSTLLVLMTLASRQISAFERFPMDAYKSLASLPGLAVELDSLSSYAGPLAALMEKLLPCAVEAAPGSPVLERTLEELLARVPLGSKEAAEKAARDVFSAAAKASFAARAAYRRALRTLDLRYPEALDAAVEAETAAMMTEEKSKKQKSKKKATVVSSAAIEQLLLDVFASTKRAPLEGSNGLSLQLAVDGPTPSLRVAALRQLDKLLLSSNSNKDLLDDDDILSDSGTSQSESLNAFLVAAVKRRLKDEDLGVVQTALSLNVTASNADAVFPDVLHSLDHVLFTGEGAQGNCSGAIRAAAHFLVNNTPTRAVPDALLGLLGMLSVSSDAAEAVLAETKHETDRFPIFAGLSSKAAMDGTSIINLLATNVGRDEEACTCLEAAYKHVLLTVPPPTAQQASTHHRLMPAARQMVLQLVERVCSDKSSESKNREALALRMLQALAEICRSISPAGAKTSCVIPKDDAQHAATIKAALEAFNTETTSMEQLDIPALMRAFAGHPDLVKALYDEHSAIAGNADAVISLLEHAAAGAVVVSPSSAAPISRVSAESVQVTALAVLADIFIASGANQGAYVLSVLLTALSCEFSSQIRKAALRAMRALLDSDQTEAWCGRDLAPAVHSVLSQLATEGSRIRDDASVAAAVVAAALSKAPSSSGQEKKRGKTPKKKSASGDVEHALGLLTKDLAGQLPLAAERRSDARVAALLCALSFDGCGDLVQPNAGNALLTYLEVQQSDTPSPSLLVDLFRASDGFMPEKVLPLIFTKDTTPTALKLEAAGALTREGPWRAAFTNVEVQPQILEALLRTLASDRREEVREAVSATLRALPVDAQNLAHILDCAVAEGGSQASTTSQTPAKKKSKAAAKADNLHIQESGLELALPALELLQTHPVCESGNAAVALLPVLGKRLLKALILELHRSSRLDYLAQLVLDAMGRLVTALLETDTDKSQHLPDLNTVVEFVQIAPGSESLSAALSLAGKLSAWQPETAVEYALQLISGSRTQGSNAEEQELGGHVMVKGSSLETMVTKAAIEALAGATKTYIASSSSHSNEEAMSDTFSDLLKRIVQASQDKPLHTRVALLGAAYNTAGSVEHAIMVLLSMKQSEEARSVVDEAVVGSGETLASAIVAKLGTPNRGAEVMMHLIATMGELCDSLEEGRMEPAKMIETVVAFVTEEVGRIRGLTSEDTASILESSLRLVEKLASYPAAQNAVRTAERLLQLLQSYIQGADYVKALMWGVHRPRFARRALALLTQHAQRASSGGDTLDPGSVDTFCTGIGGLLKADASDVPLSTIEWVLAAAGAFAMAAASAKSTTKGSATNNLLSPAAIAAESAGPLLKLLPSVLAIADNDARPGARASALAALASLAKALGARLLPQLPATMGVAVEGLSRGLDDLEENGDDEADKSNASLEALAALAVLDVLVTTLGAFLAPHVSRLLLALLRPVLVVHEDDTDLGETRRLAHRVCGRLAEAVPVRLLLTPVLALLDETVRTGGDRSVLGLVSVVREILPRLTREEITTQHEAIAAFLLRVLGVPGIVQELQMAAIATLSTLTLRLSETQFRPLFVRLHDWAGVESQNNARQLAFWGAVNVLADHLRSILVPYFKPALKEALAALNRVTLNAAASGGKKRRKTARSGDDEAGPTLADWQLALRVVRALHRAFLYDNAEPRFWEDSRVEEIMPVLSSVLRSDPPKEVEPLLERDPWSMEPTVQREESVAGKSSQKSHKPSTLQNAASAALVQLAVSCARDGVSKPLHHSVLILGRDRKARTRIAAVQTIASLVNALGEEYLVLLPEALPFVAELLEDGEHDVEAAAQVLFKQMERASGEDLSQYLRA